MVRGRRAAVAPTVRVEVSEMAEPFFAGVTPKVRLIGSERIGESAVKVTYVPA